MSDFDDFCMFQMLTSDNSSSSGRNNTPSVPSGKGCSTILIILAIAGWVGVVVDRKTINMRVEY